MVELTFGEAVYLMRKCVRLKTPNFNPDNLKCHNMCPIYKECVQFHNCPILQETYKNIYQDEE